MEKKMEEKRTDFLIILAFIWKWKWHLVIITVFAGLVAAIFSGPAFITPKYESAIIFYPSTQMSASKALVSDAVFRDDDFLTIGESEEAEQLLQILQSDRLMNKVKVKNNLMAHYGIEKDEKYANTKFANKYRKNISSDLTKYTSLRVSVIDKDPKMAAQIANDVVEYMDTIRNEMLKSRAKDGLKIVKKDYFEKKEYVDALMDSINTIASKGILDYSAQSEALNLAYGQVLQSGNRNAINKLEEKLAIVAKYGPTHSKLAAEMEFEIEELARLRNKLKEIKIDVESFVPSKFIVESAGVPERKTYPRRTLITFVSMLSAFFFAIVLLIIIENFRKVDFDKLSA